MKRMLIIHPHWPPSNTVGVHRVRLIANELYKNDWHATVLTIDEKDYEEDLSYETLKLVDPEVAVIKVRASPVRRILGKRLIGDIGLRGFRALRSRAKSILSKTSYDFIWFSLPSWYTPLMGYGLARKFNVPFGIDYRDPWVYGLADHQRGINRATFTVMIARMLEPIALRNASLVSGVSDGYLKGLTTRNPKLDTSALLTFQMGFRKSDHFIEVPNFQPPFQRGKRTYVYAGAYSPNWAPLFALWLQALAQLNNNSSLPNIEFLFIGTGNPELPGIQEQADQLGLNQLVREIPDRIPYLEVQQILRESDGAMVIGSIEPHYSASKLFQCLITAPRVFGFFHRDSEGSDILNQCQATDFFVPYHADLAEGELMAALSTKIASFVDPSHLWNANLKPLEEHSTENNALKFLQAVERVTD